MTEPRIARIARLAHREFRAGTRGFWIFLACLALGVAAITAIGTVRASIEAGLADTGTQLLGGDAQVEFTYRFADEDEWAWLRSTAAALSEIIEFRSMAVAIEDGARQRALTQIKAVDSAYPLAGTVKMEPPMELAAALAQVDGIPGAVMKPELARRLQLDIGETFTLGARTFRLAAHLIEEPDDAGAGFALGPRTIVASDDLEGSGLLGPGTLFETEYRMLLPPDQDLDAVRRDAEDRFLGKGVRWQDRRNGAPGTRAIIDRVSAFLIIVGLGGLIVGGIGIALAMGKYIESKTATIATLKVLGASQAMIFATYLLQSLLLLLAGITAGLGLGLALPLVFQRFIFTRIDLPATIGIHPAPIIEAAIYGLIIGIVFTIWALARTADVKPSALYRSAVQSPALLPPWPYLAVILIGLGVFLVTAALFSGTTLLTLYFALGTATTLVILSLMARLVHLVARRSAGSRCMRGRPALRLALGVIGGPGSGTVPMILALGLGFTVLATVGQVATNLVNRISGDLPAIAPEYFVIDIQNTQHDAYRDLVTAIPGVTRVESSPMLRGIVSRINGERAIEVAGEHWVLRGDRGITYSDQPPPGTVITRGEWWPPGHDGDPQISFSAVEGAELGLALGDRLTINVLGRDIDAVITSFRAVDFSTVGLGFILAINPAALANAPHTHISTVYGEKEISATLVDRVSAAFPNVTVISVRDGIANVMRIVGGLIAAITSAASAMLVVGFFVVIGATSREVASRVYESAILTSLGADRNTILVSLLLRSSIVGLIAGGIAVLAGSLAGFAIMTFALDSTYEFEPLSALAIVAGGIGIALLAGLLLMSGPLRAAPATILRDRGTLA